MSFMDYIRSLMAITEVPIEPSVSKLSKEKQRELREQQDLKHNAVRTAVLHEGSGDSPNSGDIAIFHYTIREPGSRAVLATTSTSHGGCGCPHVCAIDKPQRIPRGWELVLVDMKPGQHSIIETNAEYGFSSACEMPRPRGVPAGRELEAEIELLHTMPSRQAAPLPSNPAIIKSVITSAEGWQTPRPPNAVSFRWAAAPTTDFCSGSGAPPPVTDTTHTMGAGTLPAGLESALNSMPEGETAAFVMPVELLALPDGRPWAEVAGTAGHATMLLTVDLYRVEEIRDMTGDGRVLKRKLQEGTGMFPVDAPIRDAAVTIRYSLHHASSDGRPAACVHNGATEPPKQHDATFTTGEGAMPAGMEMAVKLMLPGERAEVLMHPDFGLATCDDVPPDLAAVPVDQQLVAVVELVSFEREGHPEVMDATQVLEFCQRRKERGNALYAARKFDHALKRFDHALQVMKSFRGDQTQQQTDALTALHISLLGNSAAAFMAIENYPEAIRRCEAAFSLDQSPSNFKVLVRRARATILNGDHSEADDILKAMKVQAPSDMIEEIDKLLAWSQQKARAARKKQRAEFGAF